jgi:hypothetical protein
MSRKAPSFMPSAIVAIIVQAFLGMRASSSIPFILRGDRDMD